MSSHYSYDIDERNLRTKLKGNEQSFSEDIWLKFESYQQANQKQQSIDEVVKKLSFTINRNVILPIVFGAIIISFSLLLFNFINIKKQPKEKIVSVINTASQPLPKKTQQKIIPIKPTVVLDTIAKKDTLISITTTVNATPTVAIITPTVAKIIEPAVVANTQDAWTVLENGSIYEDPNVKSSPIGNIRVKESYKAIEETVYFIKVAFTQNGAQKMGYIRKGTLAKNGQATANTVAKTTVVRISKKDKKAESLESIKAPVLLSTAEEKEVELK